MTRSESIAKLLPALIAARDAYPVLVKDAANPHYQSRYADLASVIDACQPSLCKHGLAVIQSPRWVDGSLILDTELAHTSGEWIRSQYPVIADYNRPQMIGAALTYARRYSYMAAAGIAPEDDDGETASGRGATAPPHRNGHTNGHTNGQSKPAAAAPAPAPPPAPRPAPPPRVSEGPLDRTPRPPDTGARLWRWAQEIERVHGRGVIHFLVERGRGLGLADRMVSWTQDQVASAYEDARDWLELIYAPDDDGPATFDDGRDYEHQRN